MGNVYNLYGGMVSMNATAPPPSSAMDGMHRRRMMMHMTFFWGKNGEILFHHWPGTRTGMYVLALVLVFVLSLLSEWLPRCTFLKPGSKDVASGLAQTLLHGFRVGLCYMVMLAVMSFNSGVFLVAIAGHTLGFFLFGSWVLQRSSSDEKSSDHSIC